MRNPGHTLRWVGAEAFVATPTRVSPALLRFDSDDFMDRMLALLADTPQQLPQLVAKPESWQDLAPPTPAPPPPPPQQLGPLPAPAQALARRRALLGFRRADQQAESPPSDSRTALTVAPAALRAKAPVLKLFQPVHQRFYLAAAHLVCELPGLPTRSTSGGDKSGMLLRRLVRDPRTRAPTECAFVKTPGQPGRWVPLAHNDTVLPGEDWLPLFPLAYAPPAGPARRLLAGLIPVARHDEYRFASLGLAAAPAWSRADDLKALARMKVIAPWQGLIERAVLARDATGGAQSNTPWADNATARSNAARLAYANANNQLQEASWRLLQDISEFLAAALPAVFAKLASGTLEGQAGKLLLLLQQAVWGDPQRDAVQDWLSDDVKVLARSTAPNLRLALAAMGGAGLGVSDALDNTEQPFPSGSGWPAFSFPMVVATPGPAVAGPFTAWAALPLLDAADPQDVAQRQLETLFAALGEAIVEAVTQGRAGTGMAQASHAARLAAELEATLKADTGAPRFVLRFVHQRCDCGPLHPPVLSAPSELFELAGFFDTDAPLRPIRIALPFDTSPGGLRKFGKNSAFIMSDLLCGQMKRVRRLGFGDLVLSVLPWPFHKDLDVRATAPCSTSPGNTFGTICTLSIPIITIVAFILLIVIATLLDLIFRWLPFLMACFPVPGLKGKK